MKQTILERVRDYVAPPRVIFRARPEDEIHMAANPVIFAPFKGIYVPVVGHELNEAQIRACGDFSLIQSAMKPDRALTLEDIRGFSAIQHRIVEAWMLRPSYEDLLKAVGASPISIGARDKLTKLERDLFKMRKSKDDYEAKELLAEITRLELFAECLLPSDFCAFIFSFATGMGKSDILLISDKMLLDAAVLAERGHDNPADHVAGNFTDFNRDDINLRAWYLLQLEREHKFPNYGATHGN